MKEIFDKNINGWKQLFKVFKEKPVLFSISLIYGGAQMFLILGFIFSGIIF